MKNIIISIVTLCLFCVVQQSVATLIGGDCNAGCLGIDYAICDIRNRCACNGTHVASEDNTRCLRRAEYWLSPCEETQQCTMYFEGPVVCALEHCDCEAGNHYVDHKCWPSRLLGETCTHDSECLMYEHPKRVKCGADLTCVCNEGYEPDEDNLSCSSGEANLVTMIALVPVLLLTLRRSF